MRLLWLTIRAEQLRCELLPHLVDHRGSSAACVREISHRLQKLPVATTGRSPHAQPNADLRILSHLCALHATDFKMCSFQDPSCGYLRCAIADLSVLSLQRRSAQQRPLAAESTHMNNSRVFLAWVLSFRSLRGRVRGVGEEGGGDSRDVQWSAWDGAGRRIMFHRHSIITMEHAPAQQRSSA